MKKSDTSSYKNKPAPHDSEITAPSPVIHTGNAGVPHAPVIPAKAGIQRTVIARSEVQPRHSCGGRNPHLSHTSPPHQHGVNTTKALAHKSGINPPICSKTATFNMGKTPQNPHHVENDISLYSINRYGEYTVISVTQFTSIVSHGKEDVEKCLCNYALFEDLGRQQSKSMPRHRGD